MDWKLCFMVALGWVVSGGLMYKSYEFGQKNFIESFAGKDDPTERQKIPWRQCFIGLVALGLGIPVFGFFFDDRGPNADTMSHLLGIFIAVTIAFTVGLFDGRTQHRQQMKR